MSPQDEIINKLAKQVRSDSGFDEISNLNIEDVYDKLEISRTNIDKDIKNDKFKMAIRLGEIFLEDDEDIYTKKDLLSFYIDCQKFALNLLMPRELYERELYKVEKNGVVNIPMLARKFGLPKNIVERRGYDLNLTKKSYIKYFI